MRIQTARDLSWQNCLFFKDATTFFVLSFREASHRIHNEISMHRILCSSDNSGSTRTRCGMRFTDSLPKDGTAEKMTITGKQPHIFSDLDLARRLERAEACSNARFVEARARVFPESGARWIEVAGTYAMYDGVSSPVTQTFGLGLFQPITSIELGVIESFSKNAAHRYSTRSARSPASRYRLC